MKDAGKAIKAGTLDPGGSPWFRRHYHETIGRLAASTYGSDLAAAMNDPNGPLASSTEPGDFDSFAANFRKSWLEQNVGEAGGDFSAGFNPAVVGYDTNHRNTFVSQASSRLQGKAIEALYADHQRELGSLLSSSIPRDQVISTWADWIKTRNQQQYFLNPKSGRQISETTIEAVFDAARVHQDTRILDVLDRIDSAVPGAVLSETQAVKSKIQDVRNQINSDIKKDDAAAELERKQQRRSTEDAAVDGLWAALDASTDPDSVDVQPFADLLTGISPKYKDRLYAIKDRYKQRDEAELAAQAGPLFERAFRGTLTNEEVADAFTVGQIGKDTAKELRAQIKANKAGQGAKGLVEDTNFKRAISALDGLYPNNMGPYFTPVTAAQSTIAKWQLERDWIRYRMGKGRDSGEEERTIWLQQRSAELFAQSGQIPLTGKPQETAAQLITNFAAQREQPVLTDWKATRVVASGFLARIRAEHAKSVASKSLQFSPAILSFLNAYRITKPADVEAFLAAQSAFPEKR
jgi:hypothetical protein